MDTDFELYSKENDSECFYEIWIPVEKILYRLLKVILLFLLSFIKNNTTENTF